MHGSWPMRNPPDLLTFTFRIDGSLKNYGITSGVGWILQLRDGSIDLLGLQGCHKLISPLHTELKEFSIGIEIFVSPSAVLHLLCY